jgi:hypothetical protein
MFAENFGAYADGVSEAVRSAGPRVHADPSDPPASIQRGEAPLD